ncbi:MAG TPA: glutamate formimidoyltransferase [Terriglobia bacterium]|nr:glutamate formimidoyltransferase [Terriglobia bacterium]
MQTLIECVPNFSEGRDAGKIEAIVQALLAGAGVYLLDQEMDADHNRSVITVVGTSDAIGEAALRGIGKASELIDLNRHHGAHPRLGATDVVPFVPVSGVTLEGCVRIAEFVAEQAWRRYGIPTYLYEAAARTAERRNLENIRRGQFEGLREEVKTNADRRPDFGPEPDRAGLHPTAGATVVGARKFLIAYNINLTTSDVTLAKSIAKSIRASSGGFPCVKAMGLELKARQRAQVSMNLTDFETTSIGTVFDAVSKQAAASGVRVEGSEIVGLVPRRALEDAAVYHLKVENFQPGLILENRLDSVMTTAAAIQAKPAVAAPPLLAGDPATGPLAGMAASFVNAVAAPTPTPGGGSVAALAAALGAALGEMVCRLTLKKKSFVDHYAQVGAAADRFANLRRSLMDGIDRDAESYKGVLDAMRLPKATENEQVAREAAIEEASKRAALVPLRNAELAAEVKLTLEMVRPITMPQAASDLSVALGMAAAGRAGAVENVRANLPSIQDREWVSGIEQKLG